MKKQSKPDKLIKKKRKKRRERDHRQECVERLNKMIFRADRMNRRYMRGSSAELLQVQVLLRKVGEFVLTLPAGWNPRSKGKNALIPGMKIRVKDGIDRKEMETIKHLGGAQRFYGAVITAEDGPQRFVVKCHDGVKVLIPKRYIEPISEGGPEPVVVDRDSETNKPPTKEEKKTQQAEQEPEEEEPTEENTKPDTQS